MTEPNALLLADAAIPRIRLAAKEWPVPLLAVRQNRAAVPAALRLLKLDFQSLTDAEFGDLLDLIYLALTRGHPGVTREEFDDMPITAYEAAEALTVIVRQTGLFKPAAAGSAAPSGEAPAARTGTESSPA